MRFHKMKPLSPSLQAPPTLNVLDAGRRHSPGLDVAGHLDAGCRHYPDEDSPALDVHSPALGCVNYSAADDPSWRRDEMCPDENHGCHPAAPSHYAFLRRAADRSLAQDEHRDE